MKRISKISLMLLVMLFMTGINQSQATTIDLGSVTSGTIGGAVFSVFDASKAGRGVFPSFLATQGDAGNAAGVDQGYNSDNRPVQFNETNSAQHNYSLLLSNLGVYTAPGGATYYSFTLDADQAPGSSPLIDMTMLQIYQTNNPSITGYDNVTHAFPTTGTNAAHLAYDMGVGNDVLINYLASSGGSGWADMIVDIPTNFFLGGYSNVVLFAQFSGDNDGPQEWAYLAGGNRNPVPEPGTIILLGAGLVGLARFGRKKIFKK
jgi:hypothetical protein